MLTGQPDRAQDKNPSSTDPAILLPTLEAGPALARLLPALRQQFPTAALILADGGSTDQTPALARQFQAHLVVAPVPGRGRQLRHAIAMLPALGIKAGWLLVLHADSTIPAELADRVARHMVRQPDRAAYGWLGFDAESWLARSIAGWANLRAWLFGLPYGDQGLLLPLSLYHAAGGYPDWPLMEDVALVRAIGRPRLRPLGIRIVTSAERYRRTGWWRRGWRNLGCLVAYFRGMPIGQIAERYRQP